MAADNVACSLSVRAAFAIAPMATAAELPSRYSHWYLYKILDWRDREAPDSMVAGEWVFAVRFLRLVQNCSFDTEVMIATHQIMTSTHRLTGISGSYGPKRLSHAPAAAGAVFSIHFASHWIRLLSNLSMRRSLTPDY